MTERLIKTQKVADLMGVSNGLVLKYCRNGTLPHKWLPATKKGQKLKHRVFTVAAVYKFMKENEMWLDNIEKAYPHLKEMTNEQDFN